MQATHQLQPYDVANWPPLEATRAKPQSGPQALAEVNVNARERIASTVLGGVLLARGLTNRSSSRKLLAVVGSALLFRGVTGHCHVYRWLRVSSAS
jgi:uncharacterized membrane protein